MILRPAGRIYHLEEIRDTINAEYFDTPLELPITWFGSGKIPKSSVVFGSYTYEMKLVKVNRVLDREDVPLSFVRYIVFHEMLHHIYPPKRGKRGRRDIHHIEFRTHEQIFRELDQAKAFLKLWRKKHFAIR